MKLTKIIERFWTGLPPMAVAATLTAAIATTPASAQIDDASRYFLERVASLGLVEQVLAENPQLVGWEDAVMNDIWLYHDPTGAPLFYEVGVEINGESVGRLKVGADPRLGSALLSVEMTPRPWPLADAAWASVALVQFGHPDATLLAAFLIGYDGLKTGLVVFYDDPGAGGIGFEVWDLTTLTLVPVPNLRSSLAAIPVLEYGQRNAAFIQELEYVLAVDQLLAAEDVQLNQIFEAEFTASDWNTLDQVNGALLTTEPNIMVDVSRCKLYMQETGDWCARAMHQMFNHFYTGGPIQTQTTIDAILNNMGWDTDWVASSAAYFGFYNKAWNSAFHGIASSTPTATTWPLLTDEIDAGRPFGLYTSSTSSAHIAMDVGYQETKKDLPPGVGFIGPDPFIREYWLHVYDSASGMMTVKAWKGDVMTYPGNIAGYFEVK